MVNDAYMFEAIPLEANLCSTTFSLEQSRTGALYSPNCSRQSSPRPCKPVRKEDARPNDLYDSSCIIASHLGVKRVTEVTGQPGSRPDDLTARRITSEAPPGLTLEFQVHVVLSVPTSSMSFSVRTYSK